MSAIAKDLSIALLLDFYGELLTQKQREFLEYYYNEDLSLSEIAINEGITRQGVRDAIKRAEHQLQEMERRLALASRFENMREGLGDIIQCAQTVHEQNLRCGLSREINEAAAQIRAKAETLLKD
ncbi:MAG: DNA-binding protein [Oscillospiraceae bacterium]|nr:DNA-binding protein [Oscillospiraceae bacterium]